MKSLHLISVVAVLLASAACSRSHGAEAQDARTAPVTAVVSIVKPAQRDLVDRIELAGAITADEQVTVYAKISGYLKSLPFDIGDHVKKGQLIADLDVPEMTAALSEKRAALVKAQAASAQARATVDQERAQADFAQVNYQRLKNIHDRDADVLPVQDVDQARAGQGVAAGKLKNAEAQVKVAEAAVAVAEAEINTLTTLLAYARIEAPISGVVTQRFVDPGALIQAAASSRTQAAPLVTIAKIDGVRVVVDVPEPSAAFVRAGTIASVRVANAAQSFPATITRTAGVLDPSSRTLRVEIDVPNAGERLRPGLTARVSLELRKISGAVTVPVAAVRTQGTERSVFLVVQGKAKQVKVKAGLESPDWIQITEGLRGGEDVVVASSVPLTDGTVVSVRP